MDRQAIEEQLKRQGGTIKELVRLQSFCLLFVRLFYRYCSADPYILR